MIWIALIGVLYGVVFWACLSPRFAAWAEDIERGKARLEERKRDLAERRARLEERKRCLDELC